MGKRHSEGGYWENLKQRHDALGTDITKDKCFACGRRLGKSPHMADTRDDQVVYVGRECFRMIVAAGEQGYQPPRGGPKLWAAASGM